MTARSNHPSLYSGRFRVPSPIAGHKICNQCVALKPLDNFYRNRAMADGRMSRCIECHSEHREQRRQYYLDSAFMEKQRAIEAYGGSCFCCGEDNIKLLTLDHANNDGAEWRRKLQRTMYRWLRQHGYPKDLGLRAACWNCNSGRHHNGGVCPHEEEKQTLTQLRLVA